MNADSGFNVVKGSRVKARWFAVPKSWDRTSIAGMQMKLPATEMFAEGVVTHIRGDHPVNPTRIEIAIQQSDGTEVWVSSGAIVEASPPSTVRPAFLWSSEPLSPQESTEKRMDESKSGITNTTEEVQRNPAAALVGAMLDPRFIENMEAAGQRELVKATDTLPSDGSDNPAWAAAGLVFGEKVAGDPLFRKVTLPAGWKKVATDHDMWSNLLDEKGCVRGKIFYKAAFYDRKATVYPQPRFCVDSEFDGDYPAPCRYVIRDARQKEPLFATEWAPEPEPEADPEVKREGYAKRDALRKDAEAKLLKDRPDHRNAAAYWNE